MVVLFRIVRVYAFMNPNSSDNNVLSGIIKGNTNRVILLTL